MSQFGELKRLKDEVKRLFHEGFNLIAVVDELRNDKQFAGISYERVQAFYSILQKEADAKARIEEQIEENDQEVAEFECQLAECEKQLAEHEQKVADYQKQLAEHQQEFAGYQKQVQELRSELARKQRKKRELEFLSQHQSILQQNPNNFLIYDEALVDPPFIKSFWGGRFFVTAGDRDANNVPRSISVHDMFQGKTKSFAIQTAGHIWAIYALRDPYFLLWECRLDSYYLHLAEFDFKNESLQVFQSRKFRKFDKILFNTSDLSKFLLWRRNDVDECKLVGDEIQLVKSIDIRSNYACTSYFDKKFCRLDFERQDDQFRNHKLTQVKMLYYDLETNEHSTYNLDNTPNTLDCFTFIFHWDSIVAWMRDTVFLPVRFKSLEKYCVIFTNPRIRSWKVVEFGVIDSKISQIRSFDGESLLVHAEKRKEGEPNERKVYRLQMCKPDFLRNMAWITIVKLYKEAKVENPYENARECLPLTSEIQPFMLTDSSE